MTDADTIAFGRFVLDMRNARLLAHNHEIPLRPKALAVLHHLARNAGELVSKKSLLTAVWPGISVSDSVLKVCIREIRDALDDDADAPQYIRTEVRRGYRFIAPIGASADGAAAATGSDPFATVVGRTRELAALAGWLDEADRGVRKIVFVTGEPGIGKSTLVDLFLARNDVAARVRVARGQCMERYGEGESYLPVLEALGRLCRASGGERLAAYLRQYAPTWLVQMPALLQDAELDGLQRKVQGTTHERMLREITEAIEVFAADVGLVLVLEDLQWSDYSTLELISYLARRRERTRLMVIGTYRPAEVALQKHPLHSIKQELHVHGQCEEIALSLLTEAEVAEYVGRRVTDRPAPADLAATIHRRTEGNALFMVNLFDYALVRGTLTATAAPDAVPPTTPVAVPPATPVAETVPENLRQLIEKQIEGLGAEMRGFLEVASVAGRTFAAAEVAAGARKSTEDVETELDSLASRGYLLRKEPVHEWPDGTMSAGYAFAHGFYQQVLYEQMSEAQRVRVHRMIGARKEEAFGQRTSKIAGELAHHFESGRDPEAAFGHRLQAAVNAYERRANSEQTLHLTRGLDLLEQLPESAERDWKELALRVKLAPLLQQTHGPAAPQVGDAYERARAVWTRIRAGSDTPTLLPSLPLPTLLGFTSVEFALGNLERGESLATKALDLARRDGNTVALAQAELSLGTIDLWRGRLAAARERFERCFEVPGRYDQDQTPPNYAYDARVRALSSLGLTLWHLGYPDQARTRAVEAIRVAEEVSSPFDIAGAHMFAALVHQARGDVAATRASAEAAAAIAAEHDFVFFGTIAAFFLGCVRAAGGDAVEGIAAMREALDRFQGLGHRTLGPYFQSLLAGEHARAGQVDEGIAVLDAAARDAESIGAHLTAPELSRWRGELLLARATTAPRRGRARPAPEDSPAEDCFTRALAAARTMEARSLELRSATSLCRLWRAAGRGAEAARLLAEVLGAFTEGGETADHGAARSLLDDLTRGDDAR